MTFDLVQIWAHMSVLSKAIAFGLLLMAIASIGVVLERSFAFAKGNRGTRLFIDAIRKPLDAWDLGTVKTLAAKHSESPLARLFEAAASKFLEARDHGHATRHEMTRNEVARRLEAIGADLRRGMSVLASVGSVAPFVGLLGTVVGIIAAFASIGKAGNAGIAAVSAGISEALIETAFGLLVAIPAVLFYNYLTTRVAGIELALNAAAGELLDEMEHSHGRAPLRSIEEEAA